MKNLSKNNDKTMTRDPKIKGSHSMLLGQKRKLIIMANGTSTLLRTDRLAVETLPNPEFHK